MAQSVRAHFVESAVLLELCRRRAEHDDPAAALNDLIRLIVELQRRGRFLHAWQAVATAGYVCVKLGHNDIAALLLAATRASHTGQMPLLEYLESAVVEALGADTVSDLAAKGVHLTFNDAVQLLVGVSH